MIGDFIRKVADRARSTGPAPRTAVSPTFGGMRERDLGESLAYFVHCQRGGVDDVLVYSM